MADVGDQITLLAVMGKDAGGIGGGGIDHHQREFARAPAFVLEIDDADDALRHACIPNGGYWPKPLGGDFPMCCSILTG